MKFSFRLLSLPLLPPSRSDTALFVSVDLRTVMPEQKAAFSGAMQIALFGGTPGGGEPLDWFHTTVPGRNPPALCRFEQYLPKNPNFAQERTEYPKPNPSEQKVAKHAKRIGQYFAPLANFC